MTSHKNSTKIVFKLYFIKKKRLLVVFLVMLQSYLLFAQEDKIKADSLIIRADSTISDTIYLRKISPEAIEKKVTYNAEGYKRNDLVNKKATLVRKAEVNYDNIKITADSIEFNMETSQVYATGIKDTAGSVTGKPVLEIGSQTYNADTLTYNFKTGQAVVKVIVTEQEDGLLRSRVAKMLEDQTTNIYRSTYSTCEADTPHFYINLPKAKVYPGKKIISGPGNLVLEGIPLPIFLPFGYFPVQTKRAASGIIMPRPHYEEGRGYALTDGGYYFALNNYFDLTLKGNIFTNGSWLSTVATSYNKRYKYSGNFSFTYANNVNGHKGLPDYKKAANYNIGWTFNQNPKARPGSRFSASVNMSSSGFDRNNSYNLTDHITTQRQSSISYSKTWTGTPFNFSASMNHSQNIRGKYPTINLNLPKMNFSMSRIYPLKSRKRKGPDKWYQELSFSYSAKMDNQISTYDSLLFTNKVWDNMRNGFAHEIPMSFQLRPFRNFSISPSLSYSGVMYTRKINKSWDMNYLDPVTDHIRQDTLRGYFYGHAINPSISAGYSPQIFGLFQFTNPNSRVQAIRHVMKPSVSFSYIPFLKGLSSQMYRQVQSDTTGRMTDYSIFEGGIYGTPSLSRRSGNVSFNLTNILEAKVFERDDTTGKPKNVKLIDNFGISTSYNVFADSLKWSPVNMVLRTSLLENINVSAGGNFSLYALDSQGKRQTGNFYFSKTGKPLRLTNLTFSLDLSLNELLKRDDSKQSRETNIQPTSQQNINDPELAGRNSAGQPGGPEEANIFDEYGYMKFDVPWTMNLAYSITYSKQFVSSQLIQTLMLNGSISLTKKMNVIFNSGYDFTRKEITMTQIAVNRDLHCWDMSFSWVPNGNMKMWEFSIRVKAAVLSDLKYERRKDYHDNY